MRTEGGKSIDIIQVSFPKQIKVASHTIKIEEMDDDEAFTQGLYGDFNEVMLRIRVGKNLRHTIRQETLLHEVLHAVYTCYAIGSDYDEEGTVTAMSKGLAQVLADNPEFVVFLTTEEILDETF